jgi:hypothetical protein
MNKAASLKSNNRKDSSISGRTTKPASASRTSAKTSARSSKNIVKDFMKGLTTTEELMKKKENMNKGLANIRLVLSPADMKKMNPTKLINVKFNDIAKDLLNTNDKIPKF